MLVRVLSYFDNAADEKKIIVIRKAYTQTHLHIFSNIYRMDPHLFLKRRFRTRENARCRKFEISKNLQDF